MKKSTIIHVFNIWIRTLGIFGFMHSIILVLGATRQGNADLLNIVTIFDLPLFFPSLDHNLPPFWITIVIVGFVYGIVYAMSEKKDR